MTADGQRSRTVPLAGDLRVFDREAVGHVDASGISILDQLVERLDPTGRAAIAALAPAGQRH